MKYLEKSENCISQLGTLKLQVMFLCESFSSFVQTTSFYLYTVFYHNEDSGFHSLGPEALVLATTTVCDREGFLLAVAVKKLSVKGGAANMWLNLTHFALITIYYFFFSVSFLGLSCFAFVGPFLSTTTFPVCTDMQGRGSADCFKRLDWAIHCQ